MDYARYLGETLSYGIDDHWLDQRLKTGPSLVMFDGLDEIFDPARRDHVMRQIVGFTETYPRARVIVTSRPHGYHEGILRPAGFAHYRLQDLDRTQKENFTRAWFSRVFPNDPKNANQRIDRVLSSVDRSPSVRWLAGNPLLLTIMCLIARERELPEERAEFYEQCLDVLVHQWDVNRHLQTDDLAFLTVYRKKELLRQIAFKMQASQAGLRGNFIAEEELLQITQQWFEETYELSGKDAALTSQRMIEGLWQRNYVLCPRGPKLYGFLHRTFMEFLTATEYVRRFEKTEDFTLDKLNAVFREHGNEPAWSEVLRLICGEIGDEFADRLIRTLLTLKEFPTDRLTEENQPNHLVLGIRCMSELRGLSKMDALGEFVLEQCVSFLRGASGSVRAEGELMEGMFIDAIREIGSRFSDRSKLRQIDFQLSGFSYTGRLVFPEFYCVIFNDRDAALQFAKSTDDDIRLSGLRTLVKYWPDDECRQILRQHALEDKAYENRRNALELLAGNEQSADDNTRQLLSQRAINDQNKYPRMKALELLAGNEQWADDGTRQLLSQRAIDDPDSQPRTKALELLAGNEQWADDDTRKLLSQRAIDDPDDEPRAKALELLAENEQWVDDDTRQLLRQRAIDDQNYQPRAKALELLAGNEQWVEHEETLGSAQENQRLDSHNQSSRNARLGSLLLFQQY